MKRAFLIVVLAFFSGYLSYSQKNEKPIISSHNFSNQNELWESIGNGVFNFRADIMYIYGKLYVTPIMPDNANHGLPTLTEAYLYPLYNQFKKNNSEIIPGYKGEVFLILNFVAQPLQIYKQLASEMRPLSDMLTFNLDGVQHQGRLRILIEDSNQLEIINSIKPSFLGVVGTLKDIDKKIDSYKMPLIEVDFDEITTWKGTGNIPFADFTAIKALVAKVHDQNKKISIRNCPAYKTIADLIKSTNADFMTTSEANRMLDFFQDK